MQPTWVVPGTPLFPGQGHPPYIVQPLPGLAALPCLLTQRVVSTSGRRQPQIQIAVLREGSSWDWRDAPEMVGDQNPVSSPWGAELIPCLIRRRQVDYEIPLLSDWWRLHSAQHHASYSSAFPFLASGNVNTHAAQRLPCYWFSLTKGCLSARETSVNWRIFGKQQE